MLKKYSKAEYDKFTLTEKAKHYQLKKDTGYFDKQDIAQKRSVAQVGTDDSKTGTSAGTNATKRA